MVQKIKQVKSNKKVAISKAAYFPLEFPKEILDLQLPPGAIISISNLYLGVNIPASGEVLNGYMLCDGSAIPSGYSVSGNTPNLTNGIFLRGSTQSGIGNINDNSRTLNIGQIPTHSHSGAPANTGGAGSASINTGAPGNNHNHNLTSVSAHRHAVFYNDQNTFVFTGINNFSSWLTSNGNARLATYNRDTNRSVYSGNNNSSINDSNQTRNHSHNINNPGNHAHNVSTSVNDSGGNTPVDFTPKYYNVVFLMAIR